MSSHQQIPPPEPPHGFADDEAARRLLRSRPPDRALAWVSSVTGRAVVSVRALQGGTSSAVHKLVLVGPKGRAHPVVLRRYVRCELNAEEPDIVDREQRALRLAARLPVPTPELLAYDPAGGDAGVPAVLMSCLPGAVDWWPADVDVWLRRLAEVLPLVHDLPLLGPFRQIRPFAPYPPERSQPPPWLRRPTVWQRAMEIFRGPALDDGRTFVHRDFHPGNVLWHRRTVSGLVDWQAACLGPPSADVGHCRANLLRFGLKVADRFTTIWEQLTGLTYHPWADVVMLVDFFGDADDTPPPEAGDVETALARAVAALS